MPENQQNKNFILSLNFEICINKNYTFALAIKQGSIAQLV